MIGVLLATLLLSTDWVSLVPTVAKSVPRVEIRNGDRTVACSAVVFEVDKDGFAHALTAGHCVERQPNERIDITVNGRTAAVLHSNSLLDLAILRFRAKQDVPVTLAPMEPQAGTEVAILGYAFADEAIVAQFGHVAQTINHRTKMTWVNVDLIFGDSGGSLVDGQGRLVGIVSRTFTGGILGQSAHIGAVVTVTQIRDYLDAFNEMKKKSKE